MFIYLYNKAEKKATLALKSWLLARLDTLLENGAGKIKQEEAQLFLTCKEKGEAIARIQEKRTQIDEEWHELYQECITKIDDSNDITRKAKARALMAEELENAMRILNRQLTEWQQKVYKKWTHVEEVRNEFRAKWHALKKGCSKKVEDVKEVLHSLTLGETEDEIASVERGIKADLELVVTWVGEQLAIHPYFPNKKEFLEDVQKKVDNVLTHTGKSLRVLLHEKKNIARTEFSESSTETLDKSGALTPPPYATDNTLKTPLFSPDDVKPFVLNVNEYGEKIKTGDSAFTQGACSALQSGTSGGYLNNTAINYFASNTFLPYQISATLAAQNAMLHKACFMPAIDAVRNGFEMSINETHKEFSPQILEYLKKRNKDMRIMENLAEFLGYGRMFGIRVCLPVVNSEDPEFYYKPFDINAVEPNSYKGLTQIDPQWVQPFLSGRSVSDPSWIHFYQPTYWHIAGTETGRLRNLVHRSHLIIYVYAPVADVLKPTYFFGGPSLPQLLYDRLYAAEQIANEGPPMAKTKRIMVANTDRLDSLLLNECENSALLNNMLKNINNYSMLMMGNKEGESITKLDTDLSDFDALLMSQYQLVASIAGMPASKLLGTSPKGFQSTGNLEMQHYYELLESNQKAALHPLLERHLLLLSKSEIEHKFGIQKVNVDVHFNPLDSPSKTEESTIYNNHAQADALLVREGIISREELRQKIANNPCSGFNAIDPSDLPDDAPDLYGEQLPPKFEQ